MENTVRQVSIDENFILIKYIMTCNLFKRKQKLLNVAENPKTLFNFNIHFPLEKKSITAKRDKTVYHALCTDSE